MYRAVPLWMPRRGPLSWRALSWRALAWRALAWTAAAWLVAALVATPRALAQRAPSPAQAVQAGRDRAAEGRAAFDAGRYADAARLFEAADAIDPRPAYRYSVASTYERLGRLVEAEALMAALAARQPPYAPAVEAHPRLAARLAAEWPLVAVRGAPDGATVTVDGRPLPPHGRLAVGTYALRVNHPDHYPHEAAMTVEAGAPMTVEVALAPRATHGAVTLALNAAGWSVEAGARRLDAPGRAAWILPAGGHRLAVQAPGRGWAELLIEVRPGAALSVVAPVERAPRTGGLAGGLLIGGGALAAGGLALTLGALAVDAEAADAFDCARDPAGDCTRADVRALEDRAVGLSRAAWVTYGLAALIGGAGGLVWWLDDPLPVQIGPGSVQLSQTF